jgi:hypothetical protein
VTTSYWNLRHLMWDVREWLTVKWLLGYLRRQDMLYVHATQGGPVVAVVLTMDEYNRMIADEESDVAHAHLEGR